MAMRANEDGAGKFLDSAYGHTGHDFEGHRACAVGVRDGCEPA
jgi:hypothetical protein